MDAVNRLFYITAKDEVGNSQDLLVVAAGKDEAVGYWRKHFELDEFDSYLWANPVPGVVPLRASGPIDWDELQKD